MVWIKIPTTCTISHGTSRLCFSTLPLQPRIEHLHIQNLPPHPPTFLCAPSSLSCCELHQKPTSTSPLKSSFCYHVHSQTVRYQQINNPPCQLPSLHAPHVSLMQNFYLKHSFIHANSVSSKSGNVRLTSFLLLEWVFSSICMNGVSRSAMRILLKSQTVISECLALCLTRDFSRKLQNRDRIVFNT